VLTAYFAPVYPARRVPDPEFAAPVRPPPQAIPPEGLPPRAVIDGWPVDDALAWMRAEDLFFLQTQGSGVLIFDDAAQTKALYAGNNNQPFSGVARIMRERGLLAPDNTSGEAIRRWLADHRGPEADEIIQTNPRYAFFRLAPDDGKEPAGAAGVALPAGRGVAIDPAYHAFGEVWWIDADAPKLRDAFPIYRRLVIALDTGGAIKGDVRADLYIGTGQAAGLEAGRVRHTLRLYRLVPKREP
jgi:membrane-bound lytic murein transglycosylase A